MVNKCKPAVRQIQTTDGKRWVAGRMDGRTFQVSTQSKNWKKKTSALKFSKKMCK